MNYFSKVDPNALVYDMMMFTSADYLFSPIQVCQNKREAHFLRGNYINLQFKASNVKT